MKAPPDCSDGASFSNLFTGVAATALGERGDVAGRLGGGFQLEGGSVDDVIVGHEGVAGQAVGAETEVPAVAGRLELLLPGAGDVAQKDLRPVPGPLRIFGLYRFFEQPLNHVAAHEFLVQPRIHLGTRDEVEAGHLTVMQHEQSLLARLAGEPGETFLEFFLVGFEHVAHGRRGRGHARFDLQLGNLLPDFALIGMVGSALVERSGHGTGFAGAGFRSHDVRRRRKVRGFVGPPTLFGARDGDFGFGFAADEDAGVEDAVLLGPNQFLAVHKENGGVTLIDNEKFGHGSGLGDFGDGEAAGGDGLGQRDVGQDAVLGRLQGEQNEVVVGLRFADLHRAEVVLDLIFHSFVFLHFLFGRLFAGDSCSVDPSFYQRGYDKY